MNTSAAEICYFCFSHSQSLKCSLSLSLRSVGPDLSDQQRTPSSSVSEELLLVLRLPSSPHGSWGTLLPPASPLWCFLCVTRWKLNILKDPPYPQHPSPHKLHIPALIPLQSMSFTPDYYPPYHCDHPHPYSLCPPLQIILHDTTHTHTYSSHMHTHQDIEKDFAE